MNINIGDLVNKNIENNFDIILKFKKLSDTAKIPTMAHSTDAGIDFYADEQAEILPGECKPIKLGVAWEPLGFKRKVLILKSRSGLAFKQNIECTNAGVIDSAYRGEIKALIHNFSNSKFQIKKGDKICQGILFELPNFVISEVISLNDSDRGIKGFGSSGN